MASIKVDHESVRESKDAESFYQWLGKPTGTALCNVGITWPSNVCSWMWSLLCPYRRLFVRRFSAR